MNWNSLRSLQVRSDLPKEESLLINFRVRIEKNESGGGTCRIEGIEIQPATHEIQEFFLPFVSTVHIGLDSYLKHLLGEQLSQRPFKCRLQKLLMAWIKKTIFERKLHE